MTIMTFIGAAAIALGASTAAYSQGLQPIESRRIDLGAVVGDAYYTIEQGGYRIVATFAAPGQGVTPMRVVAVLAPGQTVTFSTPSAAGLPATAVEIVRKNDELVVHKAAGID